MKYVRPFVFVLSKGAGREEGGEHDEVEMLIIRLHLIKGNKTKIVMR